MAYQSTTQDWHELLGVGPVVRAVFAGQTTITNALAELNAARDRWPGTAEDWVAVVDATIEQVELLRSVSQQQIAAMDALQDSLGEAVGPNGSWLPPPLPNPVDRILTAAELSLLGHTDEWYAEIAADYESQAEEADEELGEAEADYEAAEQDLEAAQAAAVGGDDGPDGEW